MAQEVWSLHGPLAEDPTAKVLHALLLGMLCWGLFQGLLIAPLFTATRTALLAVTLCVEPVVALSMILLQRGRLRAAGAAYLFGVWAMASALILLNHGSASIGLVYYLTLPITGAWLFGLRTAVAIAGLCAGSSLYFPETQLGTWTMIVAATILTTGPVAGVIQVMKDRLSKFQSDQAAFWRDLGYLEELLKRRTLELLEAQHQVDTANGAKRAFLASMSHDLLTPLNAILGFSTLVRSGPGLSERQYKDLEIVSRSSEQLLDLVEDMLDLSNSGASEDERIAALANWPEPAENTRGDIVTSRASGQPGLRYNYGKQTSSRSAETGAALTPEALCVLPDELCGELEAALILLDVDRVTALIRRIAATYPALGRVMENLSDKLAYTPMLRAIEARKASLVEEWR
jgi:signal transduction histidine kinase